MSGKRNRISYEHNNKHDNKVKCERYSRRPVLYSSEDVDRMTIESARARLMMQLVQPEESTTELGSYIHDLNKDATPTAKTSEGLANEVSKLVYSTYTTHVQGLSWSQPIETGVSQTDIGQDSMYVCSRCRMSDRLLDNKRRLFKNNIIQFTDTSTMTRNLVDSGCGVRTPVSKTSNTSAVSISTDNPKNVLRLPHAYPIGPAPILKKSQYTRNFIQNTENKMYGVKKQDIDMPKCSDYEKLLQSFSRKTTLYTKDSSRDDQNSRNVPYNEDSNNYKAVPNVNKSNSQTKLISPHRLINVDKQIIPDYRQIPSKYHQDCREANGSKLFNFNYPPTSPKVKTNKKSTKQGRPASIRLPRKVLTSESNIDAFMVKRKTRILSAV